VPPPAVRRIAQLLPAAQFWKLFLRSQSRRPQYLRPGDRISARIYSADGRLDLGEQQTEVVARPDAEPGQTRFKQKQVNRQASTSARNVGIGNPSWFRFLLTID
jgi:hypothetical protein